ncbi:MAG: type 2 isopentenyl-diphosphate Delta-isomerase [Pisciglobus halotolerans]|nr:type 2 isopentenyl-diphosphate Delta-isomerase [Pisciglobus halotolerans]
MKKANNRKNEHVSLAQHFYEGERSSGFSDLRFVHHSFSETNTKDIDLSTSFAGFSMDFPFYMNAMTGGSKWTKQVNEKLAAVAKETGLAMATGSVSAALKNPSVSDSFTVVRETNPNGLLFANLGAGQTVENAKRAVDLIQADALQIHLNTPQEVVMPEGDRNFSSWLSNIEEISKQLTVPVIVKEVGFGMSRKTILQLQSIGIHTIDVSGKGGTNFAQIENYRRKDYKLDSLEDWGQSTVVSLLEAQDFVSDISILSSGGIQDPFDIVKSLALGAKAAGLSGFFLHSVLKNGVDETIRTVENWKEQLITLYTLLGSRTTEELKQSDLVITGESREWCEARNIDYKSFAQRSAK